jgi:hypothetical protein
MMNRGPSYSRVMLRVDISSIISLELVKDHTFCVKLVNSLIQTTCDIWES